MSTEMNRAARRAADRAQRHAGSSRTGRRVAAGLGAAGLAASGAVLAATPATAATYTVTTLADSGAGSLRQAVLDANAAAGPDTITFATSLSGEIELTSGQILITEGVTITGPGSDVLAVSGGNESRIFEIDADTSETTTISGLTITKGREGDGDGGAVAAFDSSNLTLDHVVISDSFARGYGGGLAVNSDSVAGATVSITDSRLVGNETDNSGGGIWVSSANLTLTRVSVEDNNTVNYGGGLYGRYSEIAIVDSKVLENRSSEDGGGLYITYPGGPTTISSSVVSGNSGGDSSSSDTGGGFYFDGRSSEVFGERETLSIVDSTFADNTTADQGGGLSVYYGTATITGSEFTGNYAGSGGAVNAWYGGSVTIVQSSLTGNTAAAGGALSLNRTNIDAPTEFVVIGSTISGNRAETGGAISTSIDPRFGGDEGEGRVAQEQEQKLAAGPKPQAAADPTASSYSVELVNSTISDNTDVADDDYDAHGAIVLTDTAFLADHATIAGNTSPVTAITLDADSGATITNTIVWNPAAAGDISAVAPSVSYSLVGAPGATALTGSANIVGADPKLGPLADNGGPTATLLPGTGSPAINAGSAAVGTAPTLDQRGLPRVSGPATDIGAVEVQPPLVASGPVDAIRNDGESVTFTASATGDPTITVQWQVSADGGATWTDVVGATEPTLTFTALLEQDGLRFRAVFANGTGTVTTNAALLTVLSPTTPPTTPLTPAATQPSLAATGADTGAYLPIGLGSLGLGLAMVAAARRRRTS